MSNIACTVAGKENRIRAAFLLTFALSVSIAAGTARAYTDSELARGFFQTVFGAEHEDPSWRSETLKKFSGPVRFFIDNRASIDRTAAITAFIDTLPDAIDGLEASRVSGPAAANFRVFVVDRDQYSDIVRNEIYRRTDLEVPGRCLVRIRTGGPSIRRADAVIVSDEGEVLFRRCMIEEVLQGLGPINESSDLPDSMFNNNSKHIEFTRHDRLILNMLYDPRIRAGMTRRDVASVLPLVIRDARRRVK